MAGPPLDTPDNIRWCRYCGGKHPKEHFVRVFTRTKRRFVGWKCKVCVEVGKMPEELRDARAAKLREQTEALNKAKSANLVALQEERRINKLKDDNG